MSGCYLLLLYLVFWLQYKSWFGPSESVHNLLEHPHGKWFSGSHFIFISLSFSSFFSIFIILSVKISSQHTSSSELGGEKFLSVFIIRIQNVRGLYSTEEIIGNVNCHSVDSPQRFHRLTRYMRS